MQNSKTDRFKPMSITGLLIAAALTLSACNTIEGAGQDIQSAGEELEDAAK